MPHTLLVLVALLVGVAAIVWGAETFAEHLTDASVRLGSAPLRWRCCWPART